jgi:type I restriction enzyme S subunit
VEVCFHFDLCNKAARNDNFREFAIKSMVGSSGRQRVQVDMISNFELSKVEKEKMMGFHSSVKPLFEKITQNSIQIKTLTQLRDSLLPRLMSGKLRVNNE